VTVSLDDLAGIDALERAAVEFARTAPAAIIASSTEAMIEELFTEVCGPFGAPTADDDQVDAPWACQKCGSLRGFRRRGSQVRQRKVTSRVGTIALTSKMLYCRSCEHRFAPLGQLLGLAPRQRRTEGLSTATAALAVEVAYAKASRLMSEVGGVSVSARTIRRDVIDHAPQRIEPRGHIDAVPVLLFDGTGERAGTAKGGVALHLAIGIVSRRTLGGRTSCTVELLGATLGESWPVLFDLVANITPGLIVVDGEEELSTLCAERFASTPRQRCLWHLSRAMVKLLRYTDRASTSIVDQAVADLEKIFANAWAEKDLKAAQDCLELLAANLELDGAPAAATHLRNAAGEAFTFLTNPAAGELVTGHKGRPDVGTGVLERVMREMNRRTDVGVRWSVAGVRAILMTKLEHKYHHGRWSESQIPDDTPTVRISLKSLPQSTAA
jgi:transposase-like protein